MNELNEYCLKQRFDAIKNHKPRVANKLNEIGDILSAEYYINPDEASEMWQYIIDLNISDDVKYSKFYISQIFSKLLQKMNNSEDAIILLNMYPTRLPLLIQYGNEGFVNHGFFYNIFSYCIEHDDIESSIRCIECYSKRYEDRTENNLEIVNRVKLLCLKYINSSCHEDTAIGVLRDMEKLSNPEMNYYANIINTTLGLTEKNNIDGKILFTIKNRLSDEFFDLLWMSRNDYDEEDLKTFWIDYLSFSNSENDKRKPVIHLAKEEKDKSIFFSNIEKKSDVLLNYYFSKPELQSTEIYILWSWIETEEWEKFIIYCSLAVSSQSELNIMGSDISGFIDDAMMLYLGDNFEPEFDTEYENEKFEKSKIIKNKIEKFNCSLKEISELIQDKTKKRAYNKLISYYFSKIAKKNNSNKHKNDYNGENHNAIDHLISFAQDILNSGEDLDLRNSDYKLITRELHDLLLEERKKYGNDSDYSLNTYYTLAQNDDVIKMFFQHSINEWRISMELLSACVRKNDDNRIKQIAQLIIDRLRFEKEETRNGFSWGIKVKLDAIISEYDFNPQPWNGKKEYITDDMRETVKKFVYLLLPYLPKNEQDYVKETSLYKIDLSVFDIEKYREQIFIDIEYVTMPPKDYKKKSNDNPLAEDRLRCCFDVLSRLNRLDIISDVMNELASKKRDSFIRYDIRVNNLFSGLREGQLIRLFLMNNYIFEEWIKEKHIGEREIINLARKLSRESTIDEYSIFYDFIKKHDILEDVEDIEYDTVKNFGSIVVDNV